MPLESGTILGSYRIESELGRGGMATVYRAYQPALARSVAIKVLPEYLSHETGFKERFQQEAIAVANLRHPNIPAVHDYASAGDNTYIVSEYIDGGTLADKLGQPLSIEYVVRLLTPVAAALDYAHARGVLHRDVKPSNILMEQDGTPMLADFGLAKIMTTGHSGLTRTGMIVGTPEYMAPEQCEGEELSPAADEYALAVVAYEMLTGRPPFTGPTPVAVILAQVRDQLPPPRISNPAILERVEAILEKALAKQPADRYKSCTAFVQDLAVAAAHAPSRAPTPSPGDDEPVVVTAGTGLVAFDVPPETPAGDVAEVVAPSEVVPTAVDTVDEAPLDVPTAVGSFPEAPEIADATEEAPLPPVPISKTIEPAPASPTLTHPQRRMRLMVAAPVAGLVVVAMAAGAVGLTRAIELSANLSPTAAVHSPAASIAPSPSPSPSAASPTPSASVSPTPAPAGTKAPKPAITVGPWNGEWQVRGSNFTPGKPFAIWVYNPPNASNWVGVYPFSPSNLVAADGTFVSHSTLSGQQGTLRIVACDSTNLCASAVYTK